MPPLPRSSPEGATTEWTVIALADEAYYSFIDPELALLADLQRTVKPYKWLHISCRSGADQWKLAGQRPTFYHRAIQPTNLFDNFLTSFATNILPKCHKLGYKPNKFLLAPLAALFCTPILKMVAPPIIAMVSWVHLPVTIALSP